MNEHTTPKEQMLDHSKIVRVSVDRLLLDAENPRLAPDAESTSQFDLLKILWTEMAVDELVVSIAANGYFEEEPMFVIPQEPGMDPADPCTKLVVVEGNRRLAAVLILLNDEWRQELKATDLPTISAEQKAELRELPVSFYENRRILWSFLSFRHINSPKAWDPYSKVKFIAQVHDEYGESLDEIARKTGDRNAVVKRLYRGYKVLLQAENQADFSPEDISRNRFYFSHLYTAVDYPEFQRFLGIDPTAFPESNPVPQTHLQNLSDLMTWLYGKKSAGKEPIVRKQNPDLRQLAAVVSKPDALEELRSDYGLAIAYNTSKGDQLLFREALATARQALKQANSTVATGYDGDVSHYDAMGDIERLTKNLKREMKRLYESAIRRTTR